jgi:hypothetical protein
MLPPLSFTTRVQVKPVPVPPDAVKVIFPPTAALGFAGEIVRGLSTVTDVVAEFPTESLTRTVSVPGVDPAT